MEAGEFWETTYLGLPTSSLPTKPKPGSYSPSSYRKQRGNTNYQGELILGNSIAYQCPALKGIKHFVPEEQVLFFYGYIYIKWPRYETLI